MVAVGISSFPTYARLTRASVLSARQQLYVEAARVVGASDGAILVRHILPNVVAPIIVVSTLGIGAAILIAATLSFSASAVSRRRPNGAACSARGASTCEQWWLATFPGLAVMLTVLALNMLGDGLRDAFDRRLKV